MLGRGGKGRDKRKGQGVREGRRGKVRKGNREGGEGNKGREKRRGRVRKHTEEGYVRDKEGRERCPHTQHTTRTCSCQY